MTSVRSLAGKLKYGMYSKWPSVCLMCTAQARAPSGQLSCRAPAGSDGPVITKNHNAAQYRPSAGPRGVHLTHTVLPGRSIDPGS